MLVFRKLALHEDETGRFQIGDQIQVDRYNTATCQKVEKKTEQSLCSTSIWTRLRL